jgi:uncharacterized membrane protein (UPF0127 family)
MKVKIFRDNAEKIIGFSNKSSIDKNYGGLFLNTNKITMKDTSFPLGLVFINKDNKISSIQEGKPFSTKLYEDDSASKVLEVNHSIIDKFKINQLINVDKLRKLKFQQGGINRSSDVLLDHKGEVQMDLEMGELIISRKETKELTELAAKADTERELVELGRMMYDIRIKQKNRKPEFV